MNSDHQNKKITRVAHSLADLQDELILTLKDRPILMQNSKQIDEEDDELENQEIQTNNRFKHNANIRSKLKELSDVSKSHMVGGLKENDGILPHYDDYSFKTDQVEIDESKGSVKEKRKTKRDFETENDFLQTDFNVTKLGAQYTTKMKFKKNKAQKEQQTSNASKDLLDFLNDTAQDPINKDQDQNGRMKNAQSIYDQAIESIRKKRILEYNAKRQTEVVDISSVLSNANDQEDELNSALRKAQRKNNIDHKQGQRINILAMIKQEEQEGHQDDHDNLGEGSKDSQNQRSNPKGTQLQLNPISYRADDKKYLKQDFFQLNNGGKSSLGTTSAMFIKLPSERLVDKKNEVENDKQAQSMKDITPEQLQKMRQEVSFLQDKELGIGLSHTLQYLRDNSLLGNEEETGRYTDKSTGHINQPGDRVKLQYRNSSGKLMKPKQAYRYICATFHGEGPGKKKVEIRKRRELEEQRMKEKSNRGGQLMSLLGEHQRKTQESHMVLDIGSKRQTQKN